MNKFEMIKAEWREIFAGMSKTEGTGRLERGELTVEHYKSILKQIYFHTRENPQIQAAATAYFRGHQRDMVKMFYQHAISEIGHDQMALRDLQTLGEDIASIPDERPLPATIALISFPYYAMQYLNPLTYLGYLFHLEFMPTQNGHKYMDILERIGVPREAMTFIEEHSTVDVAHNKLMERYVAHLVRTDDDYDAVLFGAETCAKLYSTFLQDAIETGDRKAAGLEKPRAGWSRELVVSPHPEALA